MTENKSAVTPERYASGFTYANYIAQITVNKDRFAQFYDSAKISPSDIDFFHKAKQAKNGVAKIMVIGEDWCPDVYRGLPAAVRVAEAVGLELRIFPRDKNTDIMNEFLNQGKYMSIPVVVFFTKDLKEICRWIERPDSANTERNQIVEQVRKEMPGANEQEFRAETTKRLAPKQVEWQKMSVIEWRKTITEKLEMK